MADISKNSPKPWWESRLDWNLPENLQDTLKLGRHLLRNIPETLNAYKIAKANELLDQVEPDPVERVKTTVTSSKPKPPIIPPPPPKPLPPAAVAKPPVGADLPVRPQEPPEVTKPQKKITLELLLDPEFTDY